MKDYKPTPAQYRKDYYNALTLLQKIQVNLKVIQYQHLGFSDGSFLTYSRVNPWNPLSYMLMLIIFIAAMIGNFWENLLACIDSFKYE